MKRFVQADLAPTVRRLWTKHNGHFEPRERLLWLIWLGQLKDCADLAEAAFHSYQDRRTRIVAGRAIVSAGDDAMKRRYGEYIHAHCSALPNALIVNAVDHLFPTFVTVGDLLHIFQQIDITDADDGLHVEWQAPGWIERLKNRRELSSSCGDCLISLGPKLRISVTFLISAKKPISARSQRQPADCWKNAARTKRRSMPLMPR